MAQKVHFQYIGILSSLFAFGLIVASAVLLSSVSTNYNKFKYHYQDQNYKMKEGTKAFSKSQYSSDKTDSSKVVHSNGGKEMKNHEQRDQDDIDASNHRIKMADPVLYNKLSKKTEKKIKMSFGIGKDMFKVVSSEVGSVKPSTSVITTAEINKKLGNLNIGSMVLHPKVNLENVSLASATTGKVKRSHEKVKNSVMTIISNCPSLGEYKLFIALSSAGVILGVFQMLVAALSCCPTRKVGQGISSLLIVYNLCLCVVLVIMFILTIVKGYCTRSHLESSAWLAFTTLLGVDTIAVCTIVCYVTYILATGFEATVKTPQADSSVKNYSEDDDGGDDLEDPQDGLKVAIL